jgi:hypothetical protein
LSDPPAKVRSMDNEPCPPGGPKNFDETFLGYARPLLDRLPADYTTDELIWTLQFAVGVWNAVILRDIRGAREHLATRMPRRLRVRPSRQWGAIRRLLRRKHRDFYDDDHFIAAVAVEREQEVAHVTAIGVCADPRCCRPQAEA